MCVCVCVWERERERQTERERERERERQREREGESENAGIEDFVRESFVSARLLEFEYNSIYLNITQWIWIQPNWIQLKARWIWIQLNLFADNSIYLNTTQRICIQLNEFAYRKNEYNSRLVEFEYNSIYCALLEWSCTFLCEREHQYGGWQRVAACCSVLQRVAVCCGSVLWCVAHLIVHCSNGWLSTFIRTVPNKKRFSHIHNTGVTHRTKSFLEFSGCRTLPLETSRCRPRLIH